MKKRISTPDETISNERNGANYKIKDTAAAADGNKEKKTEKTEPKKKTKDKTSLPEVELSEEGKAKKEEQSKLVTPSEYFEYVKGKKNETKSEDLENLYTMLLQRIQKYEITGQVHALKKTLLYLNMVEVEMKIYQAGFTQFVLRTDIEKYIEEISDKSVAIIDLPHYHGEIPDDKIEIISKAREIFKAEEMYVIFTDYTSEETKRVAKERREKDPILFGAITHDDTVLDKLYFICDWVDPNCDLTFNKMLGEFAKSEKYKDKEIAHNIPSRQNIEDLRKEYDLLSTDEEMTKFMFDKITKK